MAQQVRPIVFIHGFGGRDHLHKQRAGVEGKAAVNQGRVNGKGWDHTGVLALLRPLCLPHLPHVTVRCKPRWPAGPHS